MLFWIIVIVFGVPLYLLIADVTREKSERKRELLRIQQRLREKEQAATDENVNEDE